MLNKNLILCVGLLVSIGLSYWFCFSLGKAAGEAVVYQEIQVAKDRYDAQIKSMREAALIQEALHTTNSRKLTNELVESKLAYENALAEHRNDYSKRVLLAETRASTYRNKANGTAAERDYLAEHATRLDRSLEEGRSLVRELGETIRQRDVVIRSLAQQIQLDRKLFAE